MPQDHLSSISPAADQRIARAPTPIVINVYDLIRVSVVNQEDQGARADGFTSLSPVQSMTYYGT